MIAFELDYQLHSFDAALIIDHSARTMNRTGPSAPSVRAGLDNEVDVLHQVVLSSVPSARTIVVEDSFAMRSDPNRPGCAYADERVLRWRAIDRSRQPDDAEFLRAGAHGVPLCGYITTRLASEHGLSEGASLSSDSMGSIANATIAAVFPLLDEECFLFMCRFAAYSSEPGGP